MADNISANMRISSLAEQAGVSVETIRFYQRKQLLRAPSRLLEGVRMYGPMDLSRLKLIKSAQRLGFSLNDVAQLIPHLDNPNCVAVQAEAQRRLDEVNGKLRELEDVRTTLVDMLKQCRTMGSPTCCPLIDSLQETNSR